MMRPRSEPSMPARSSACRAAWIAIVEAVSLAAAMCRSLMPERDVIHSSVVSSIRSKSAFDRIFSGTYMPHPVIALYPLIPLLIVVCPRTGRPALVRPHLRRGHVLRTGVFRAIVAYFMLAGALSVRQQ